MGVLGKMRHNLGLHTGEWTYDVEGHCEQTRTCTGCPVVSTRTEHSFTDWYRRRPCDEETCGMIRTCRVCDDVKFKQQHEVAWHYFSELRGMPDFAAMPRLAKVRVMSPCKQFSMCEHCYQTSRDYRVWHDWGPRLVGGVERINMGTLDDLEVELYYRACKVCDKRMQG